ncbi:MAG: putative polymerase subfamily sigma factor [Ilumatobacteraceae bacterium]|nr:putative polymerase subfamily sigma factor [Ilumatobacteraceae bacterium]
MVVAREEGPSRDEAVPETSGVRVSVEFERFYESTYRRTLALAYAVTGDRGHAEDLVQDAFDAAHRRWGTIANYDDPQAWVRRAVLNKAATRWTRLAREVRALARYAGRMPTEAVEEQPDSAPFWTAVASLPRRQAQAVALYYVDDLPIAEIADLLGCSTGTVKTHLSRARLALHERLGNVSMEVELG